MMLRAAAMAWAPAPRQWLLPLSSLVAASLLLGVVYWQAIEAAVRAWWISPTFSHCFLIIPISAFLVWRKRDLLARLAPDPYPPAFLLAVPAGLLWLAGNVSAVNEAQQIAAVTMFQMLVLGILGPRIYRVILFPCLFLFFLVPTGEYLITPLQNLTTRFVSLGLTLLGILHFTEGNVIQLSNGTFQVAQACAGLRFLVANIVLCVLFAHFAFRRPAKIVLFMLAAIVVPILGNGLRALFIVLLAHWTNNRLAVGADHLVYGWGFSVAILLVLFAVGAWFRDHTPADGPFLYLADLHVTPPLRHLFLAATAAMLVLAPPAIASARNVLTSQSVPALGQPMRTGWTVKPEPAAWSPDLPAGDTQLRLELRRGNGAPVDFLLDYYVTTDKDHTLILGLERLWDERRYNLLAVSEVAARWNGRGHQLSELILGSQRERRMVWWSYWKADQFTTSGMMVRWLGLKNALDPRTDSAFIAISVPVTGTEDEARAQLRGAAWALGMLPGGGS